MKKTFIIYAASAIHSALVEKVITPAREHGQSVRLVGTDFFNGDAETNAAGVLVVRTEGDDALFERIEATYPDIEVKSATEDDLELPSLTIEEANTPDPYADEIRVLRGQLVGLGGSVPAGASAEDLRKMISAKEIEIQKANEEEGQKQADAKAAEEAKAKEKEAAAKAKADAKAAEEAKK